jgi:hypothetical protein
MSFVFSPKNSLKFTATLIFKTHNRQALAHENQAFHELDDEHQ